MGLLFDKLEEGQGRHLLHQRLEANSIRKAWYDVVLQEHPGGGYLIIKRSGPAGTSIGCSEIWFRWKLADAMQKYQGIVKQKKAPKKGRVYVEVEAGLF